MIDVLSNLEDFGEGEEPWCDLTFEVESVRRKFWSSTVTMNCVAQDETRVVGFWASVRAKDWKIARSKDEEAPSFWWGKVTLGSEGATSDNLLRLMQRYYGFEARGSFPQTIKCSAVSLEGDPTNIAEGAVRTKLFFDRGSDDDADEDSYAELYFNVDLNTRRAFLNEKDPEYRGPLVRWLSGELRAS